MKKYLALVLAAALCLGAVPALAAEHFPTVNQYAGYGDVRETDWFYDNAKLCYEVGIMTGTDKGFEPEKVLTVGECTAIAARIREALTGEPIQMMEDAPWYLPYAEYMRAVDPLLTGLTAHALDESTRYEFLRLLSAALPGELVSINQIETLPDCDDEMVLRFYNTGILTGMDKYGTFAPGKTLTRAEAAAMVSRIARFELRKTFVPADYSPFTAARLTPETAMFSNGLSAEEYLTTVNNAITAWEEALGDDFNWHTVWSDGKSVLNHVKDDSLAALGVTEDMGTQAYQDFDVQVYYSRLIDLMGGPLGA